MLNFNIVNKEILEKLFEDTDKLLLSIDSDTKILDYSESFQPYKKSFTHLIDMVTYTHAKEFLSRLENLSQNNPIIKFTSNFSFDKYDVEDIPSSYEIILYYSEDIIYVLADPKPPLSHNDAKMYLSLVDNYSQSSRELSKTKYKLQKLNQNLEHEIEKGVQELRVKDELLLKTSQDAAIGAMIDSIAHQWKNPLSAISLVGQTMLIESQMDDELDIQEVIENSQKIINLTDHMFEVLDEFRSFFRPNIPLQEVTIKSILSSINLVMKDMLIKNKIELQIVGDTDLTIDVIPNQFKHVLINLISNSKDAFVENSIENRVVTIAVKKENHSVVLSICDNAGGISQDIIPNIFEANFTTKEVGKGTGIGLYLVKQIIDKIGASIEVYNKNKGICFIITIEKEKF